MVGSTDRPGDDAQPKRTVAATKKAAATVTAPAPAAAGKKTAPAKTAPAKTAPAKTAPAKTAAANGAPAKTAPVKAPAKSTTAAARTAPAKEPAAKAAAVKAAPAKIAPAKTAPAKAAPAKAPAKAAAKTTVVRRGAAKGPFELPPVREGEEAWTTDELAEIRTELEEQARELRGEIDDAEIAWHELQRDSGDGAGDDQADAGTKTFEREHELSLANNSRDLLAQVDRALSRLDNGTYGVCENCGQPVGKARLQAFPRATLCVTCKQREERR
jgi:RNA polymerase-binding protein DksA